MDRFTSETPAAVAKRMSDLLLCFPAAAAGGVEWKTLVSKYNERHSTNLDIAALGHSSALVAATAFLWDDLRMVDGRDQTNPVVAIDDAAAMTAEPNAAATWPSLYKSLCEIVSEHGPIEEEVSGDEVARAILVSQLKPLLQRHWHKVFDESSLSYITDQGKFVRVKKMKHLLQALMQWREQRVACGRHTEVDEALKLHLEVVPSKKHNDLLLRCVQPSSRPSTASDSQSDASRATPTDCQSAASESTTSATTRGSADSIHIMDELAFLRAENDRLRNKNCILEQAQHGAGQNEPVVIAQHDAGQKESMCIPVRPRSPSPLPKNVWDDPSEPPPFEYRGSIGTPSTSTAVPSSFNSGDVTPLTRASGSHADSASATPSMTTWVWDGQNGHLCSMVPMFYVMGDRGLHDVPNGVVHQAVSMWETKETSKELPSYFTMGARES